MHIRNHALAVAIGKRQLANYLVFMRLQVAPPIHATN